MIVNASQMLKAEKTAFASGETAENLMELAGLQMALMVRQFHPRPGRCVVFFGKGHNGGDVLVAARHLVEWGWSVELEKIFPDAELAPLTASRLSLIQNTPPSSQASSTVVLDGLLGIGGLGNPREPVASAIHRINELRQTQAAWVLSADVPSGLTESGPGNPCVAADATIAMGLVKTCLLHDDATNFVGRLAIASLPGIIPPACADNAEIISPANLRALLPPRAFDTHKGHFGRVAIIAGSKDYPGAARLCSAAAVRGGAGLVTLYVPPDITPVLASAVCPEVMVSPVTDLRDLLDRNFDVAAIGPGLGRERDSEVREFIARCAAPCVVDADALNALSESPDLLKSCAGPRLLTPHPLEMERLFPRGPLTRREWLEAFVAEYPATLLLKGARTIIGEAGLPTFYNSTGHPGMASGGMGDVLSGVCAALLAQKKSLLDASRLAAWACGHAAELALRDGDASQESLAASDIIAHLGLAFNDLRAGVL